MSRKLSGFIMSKYSNKFKIMVVKEYRTLQESLRLWKKKLKTIQLNLILSYLNN
jgi:hypothetical protein